MSFKPIAGHFFAEKIGRNGTIEYGLSIDEAGKLYVRFEANDVNTAVPGSFSSLYFSVIEYAPIRNSESDIGHPSGFDESGTRKNSSNNNDGAFLKAVLRHLLP